MSELGHKENQRIEDFFNLGIVYIENEPSDMTFVLNFCKKPTIYDQDVTIQYTGELSIHITVFLYFKTEYRNIKLQIYLS